MCWRSSSYGFFNLLDASHWQRLITRWHAAIMVTLSHLLSAPESECGGGGVWCVCVCVCTFIFLVISAGPLVYTLTLSGSTVLSGTIFLDLGLRLSYDKYFRTIKLLLITQINLLFTYISCLLQRLLLTVLWQVVLTTKLGWPSRNVQSG